MANQRATVLIGYDLNKPEKDYPKLIDAIKAISGTWWHNLDSTWIVKTDKKAMDVCNILKNYVDANDELFVVTLTRDAAWIGFDKEASDWLKANL